MHEQTSIGLLQKQQTKLPNLGQTDDNGTSCQESADDGSGQEVCHKAKTQQTEHQVNDGDQQRNLHQPDTQFL